MDYEVVNDWNRLVSLRAEWEELWKRVPSNYLLDSFEWAKLCWEIPREPGSSLYCLIGRDGGELRLIWPLAISRHQGFIIAKPLATEWGDYSTILADRVDDLESAWDMAQRTCRCDLFHLPFVREHSALNRAILAGAKPRVALYTLPAPWIRRAGADSWEHYYRALSRQRRMKLARQERRLAELGDLRFELIFDPERARPVIDWILERKRAWIRQSGVEDAAHTDAPELPQFLNAAMAEIGPRKRWVLFALRLDDKVIAADLSSIEHHRAGWYLGSFDADYNKYSVGMILRKRAVRWAFEQGLDVDMRLGDNLYKQFWQNEVETTITYRCSNSVRGMGYVFGKRGVAAVRRIGADVEGRLRARLRPIHGDPAPAVDDP